MKDTTDEMNEAVVRFVTEEVPWMVREVVDECIKRGIEIDFIRDNSEELVLMMDACIDEEFKLCKEITGRSGLTSEEMISVVADKIIKYAEQKQKSLQ